MWASERAVEGCPDPEAEVIRKTCLPSSIALACTVAVLDKGDSTGTRFQRLETTIAARAAFKAARLAGGFNRIKRSINFAR